MSAPFDPYHKWLGIPPAEQPPNLYRLLAIPLFETDADVIDGAADGRMTHLRSFSAGKNAPIAQKLLNEISAARVTLLNPQARAAYDAQLHGYLAAMEAARLHAQQAHVPPPPVLPPGVEQPTPGGGYAPFAPAPAAPVFDINAGSYGGRSSRGAPILLIAFIGCLAAAATIGGLWYVLRGTQTGEVVVDNPVTDPEKANPPISDNGDGSTQPPPVVPNPPEGNGTIAPTVDTPKTVDPAAPPTTNTSPPSTTVPATPPTTSTDTNANPGTNNSSRSANEPKIVELKGHEGPVLSVDFSADGKLVVSGGEDKTVRVWDVERGQPARLFQGMPSAVRCVRLSGDGKFIAIACPEPDRLLRVWDVNRPTEAVDMRLEGDIQSFEFSADGSALVAGSEGVVQVFNAKTGALLRKFNFNGNSTAVSTDGRRLAAAGPGNVIRLFETSSDDPTELSGSKGTIGGIALSGDDRILVSGGSDRLLRVWDLQGERQILRVRAPGQIRSVAVNEDGRRCASLGERFVSAWNLADRKQIFSHKQAGDCQPAISSDGLTLLMGDEDGTVRLVSLPPLPSTPLPQSLAADDPENSDGPELSDLVNRAPRVKQQPPSESEIAEATKQLQEIYPKTEAKPADEQLQLAENLMQLAATSEQAVDQYALLQFATTLAQRGGDARLTLKAIDELASRFTIDPLPLKTRELALLAKGAKDEATVDSLVSVATTVVHAAAAAGQMEQASDLIDAVAAACAKAWGRRHAKAIAEYRTEFVKTKKPWAAAQLAKTKLETDPDNAEANTALGIWTALELGDWSTGLPMLAKGDDEKLKALADQDLAAEQGGPPAQLKAADAWYDTAQAMGETHKPAMLRRAGHWYTAVLPMVKHQIARLKFEGRLEEIAKLPSSGQAVAENGELALGKPVYVLGLTNLMRDALGGAEWSKQREAIAVEFPQHDGKFMLPVELEGSYEFEFDFTAPRGQVVAWLPVGDRGCQLWIAEGQQAISGLSFIDGERADRNPTRTPMPKLDWTKRHTATVRVEQTGDQANIEAALDGKPLLRWRGPTASLSGDMRNAIRDPRQLALGSMNAPLIFHTAKVKLLEGSGKVLAQGN